MKQCHGCWPGCGWKDIPASRPQQKIISYPVKRLTFFRSVLPKLLSCACESPAVLVKKIASWDFPGGPGVRTPCFHCRGHGSNPWSGNLNPACHAMQHHHLPTPHQIASFPAGMSWGLRVYILTNILFHTLYFEWQGFRHGSWIFACTIIYSWPW